MRILDILLYILIFSIQTWSVSGREIGNFYQDLTDIIEDCLKGDLTGRVELEKALTKSTFVYYSTDLLLNNISQIVPVLNLLNSAKPRSLRYYLMLGLRYTNKNQFDWRRLDDVYYNLSLRISTETKNTLRKHLTSVVLDWNMDSCPEASSFFAKDVKHHSYGFDPAPMVLNADSTMTTFPYSIPKYVQNFLSYYLCEKYLAGNECTTVPVGVAYEASQLTCGEYLLPQIKDADFIVVSIAFASSVNFVFSYQMFRAYLNNFASQNEQFLESKWEKGLVYRVNLNDPPSSSQIRDGWKVQWNELETLLNTSPFYIEAVENLITKTYKKSATLLEAFLFLYTLDITRSSTGQAPDTSPGGKKFSIILGMSMVQNFILSEKEDDLLLPTSLLVPHLFTDEIEASACSLRNGLTATGSGKLIVDLNTWRAAARYKDQIHSPKTNCSVDKVKPEDISTRGDTNITILFNDHVISVWDDLQRFIVQLLKETPNVAQATLRTLAFPESGFYETTISFLSNVSKTNNYSIACVVEFNKEKLEILKLKAIFSEELKFDSAMEGLCGNSFELVDEFIWNIDQVEGTAEKELLVLAQEIFLKEFPDKLVTLQISPDTKFADDFVGSWSVFYGVPVAV